MNRSFARFTHAFVASATLAAAVVAAPAYAVDSSRS
jgi:putative tricarboxylic transport membrane protein